MRRDRERENATTIYPENKDYCRGQRTEKSEKEKRDSKHTGMTLY